MGFVKQMQIQQDEQGWSFTDQFVCARCVDESVLSAIVDQAGDDDEDCGFCGTSPAAPLDVLLEAFMEGLRYEYGTADNEGVIWESAEGGYQWGHTWGTWDLVTDYFGDLFVGPGLVEAVRSAIHDVTWVERDFAVPRVDEALSSAWQQFRDAVMHKTRYMFWLVPEDDDYDARSYGEVPPSEILFEVASLIEELGLVRCLAAGERAWRARTHREEAVDWGATDLGTAPVHLAKQANRMSPPGIPMFYGAADRESAATEASFRSDDPWVTVGEFVTSVEATVVDFTRIPRIPSLFDSERRHLRRPLTFLHAFVAELSRPARESWEHLDYVPTQIVTEFLVRIFREGRGIDGIVFRAALTGAASLVLDVPNDRCVDLEDGWNTTAVLHLGLDPTTVEHRRA